MEKWIENSLTLFLPGLWIRIQVFGLFPILVIKIFQISKFKHSEQRCGAGKLNFGSGLNTKTYFILSDPYLFISRGSDAEPANPLCILNYFLSHECVVAQHYSLKMYG